MSPPPGGPPSASPAQSRSAAAPLAGAPATRSSSIVTERYEPGTAMGYEAARGAPPRGLEGSRAHRAMSSFH